MATEQNDPGVFQGRVADSAFAQALAETTQTLVCVLDRHGRILFFNEACERSTGFTRHEVLGRDARDFVIPPEERGAFGDVLAYVWSTGLSSPQVGHWLTKDGGRRLIAWSNKPVVDDDGAVIYLVTSGLDLTEPNGENGNGDALSGDRDAKLAEVGRLAQEQRALRRVATLVASEASPEQVFAAVSQECARVLDVSASAVFRYEGNDTATVVARHARDGVGAFPLGSRVQATESTTIGRILVSHKPERIDDYTSLIGEAAETMQRVGYRSTVSAPIVVAGLLWGAVAVASTEILPPDSEARLGAFCELVSLAVASAQAREDLRRSRARLVRAGDEQRRKFERNLHDGAQQRLVALALTLRLARTKLATAPETADELLAQATAELDDALSELRELARGLHPVLLTDHGLRPALVRLAERSSVPVELDVPDARFPDHVEATAYYIATEALANVTKHAEAATARVVVSTDGQSLRIEITDDGKGGAEPAEGTGILGLRDRAEAAGGSLVVISRPGIGTVVTGVLPLRQT
ncbi:MAG TPA: PAS domain S-box protein [Gaiellaceae bacterium]|nr:PAS domain S-box protein [Gaiellaceae bacterium]